MLKLDFKKETPALYKPAAGRFSVIDVPTMTFLMVDGKGDPGNAPAYQEAIQALYPLAYKLKFLSKETLKRDYVVPPLEGLWWAEDMSAFTEGRRDEWLWTLMIRQPGWITTSMFEEIKKKVSQSVQMDMLENIQLSTYSEGLSVQTMHIGPYHDEGPVLEEMHSHFTPENELAMSGKHHEIYLSDPRRAQPEKLRTILRQPVKPAKKKAELTSPASMSRTMQETAA